MTDRIIVTYLAAYHLGYFNNKDISELFSESIITKFYEIMNITSDKCKSINISHGLKSKIIEMNKHISNVEKYADEITKLCKLNEIDIVTELDNDYPLLWRTLNGMPRAFFIKGNRELLDSSNGIACVVGSRSPSQYSKFATNDIVSSLVKKGITIVSGLAGGIDRVAHETALKLNGKTIAILAGGPDCIYPTFNKDIYASIASTGLIISEMPPGRKAQKQYFPSRNRLISGISDVCLIMEAGEHSGTLHTASFAASQGREVFVLPNTIYCENGIGGLMLINDGARVLLSAECVIEEIAQRVYYRLIDNYSAKCKIDTESSLEDKVISLLSIRSFTSDELVKKLQIDYSTITNCLSLMEIHGKVIIERGKYTLTINKQ